MSKNNGGNGLLGCAVFALVIVVVGVLLVMRLAGGVMPNYSDGQRSGTLMKFSRKGIIWKSWEGELLLHDFRRSEGQGSNIWEFSTMDDALAVKIEEAMKSGGSVTIGYHQYLIAPVSQSTAYTAQSVDASK